MRARYTEEELRHAVAVSKSIKDVARVLGLFGSTSTRRGLKRRINALNISTAHFTTREYKKPPATKKKSLEELLNSPATRSTSLKKRLLDDKILEARCNICNLTEWLSEPIPLVLDHINGNHSDNRLENLRILCPNCHFKTPTFSGRDKILFKK